MMAILRVLVGKQFWRGFAPPILDTVYTMFLATWTIHGLKTEVLGCARLCIIICHLISPHEVRYDF